MVPTTKNVSTPAIAFPRCSLLIWITASVKAEEATAESPTAMMIQITKDKSKKEFESSTLLRNPNIKLTLNFLKNKTI